MFFGTGYCASMGWGGWLLMIGAWAAVIAVAVWAILRLFPSSRRTAAEDLLDRRLAAGEIDPDSYRQVHDELVGTGKG